MIITSVGLFDSVSQMVRAVEILRGCGFSRDEISVVTHKSETNEIVVMQQRARTILLTS